MTTPASNTKEKMAFIGIKKGDIIAVPCASVSWWYNYGDSDVVIVFLADATDAYVAGEITYFLLMGPLGHLHAFSLESIAKTYQITPQKAQKLASNQKGILIIKFNQEQDKTIPKPNEELLYIYTQNINASLPDVEVNNGGSFTTLNPTKFPFLNKWGLMLVAWYLKLMPLGHHGMHRIHKRCML